MFDLTAFAKREKLRGSFHFVTGITRAPLSRATDLVTGIFICSDLSAADDCGAGFPSRLPVRPSFGPSFGVAAWRSGAFIVLNIG